MTSNAFARKLLKNIEFREHTYCNTKNDWERYQMHYKYETLFIFN